jgi:EpsD family peptidyl-prolyl cis-trans isomerase
MVSAKNTMEKSAKLLIVLTLLLAVAACGRTDGSKPASQIAVKVNGDEITVHQLNEVLARMGPVANMPPERVRTLALDRLVDQQLAIQKAKETKLDRDANVLTAIENNRRQILSQAYVEKMAATATAPTPQEIQAYYKAHPELFAKRRIYRFQEIAAGVNDEQRALLEARLKTAKNFNELASWMREKQIPFNADFSLKAAEQLPMGTLPRFQAMKPGEIATFPAAGRILIVQLMAAQEAAMSEKDAEPFISRFLSGQKRSELASNELKQLRTVAKLEYVGDFAKKKDDATAAAPAAVKAAAKEVVAKEPAKSDAGSMDKALSGLK